MTKAEKHAHKLGFKRPYFFYSIPVYLVDLNTEHDRPHDLRIRNASNKHTNCKWLTFNKRIEDIQDRLLLCIPPRRAPIEIYKKDPSRISGRYYLKAEISQKRFFEIPNIKTLMEET